MARNKKNKPNYRYFAKIFLILFVIYIIFILLRSFKKSVIITGKDRLDLVYYGEQTTLLSLGLTDRVNYISFFDNDLMVVVPGGFGRYKVGSLGKLAGLEKKPIIIKRALTGAMSNYIDYYLIPKKAPIFFHETSADDADFYIPKMNLIDVLVPTRFDTDANFIDRFYLFFKMGSLRKSDFIRIDTDVLSDEENKIFSENDFSKRYTGYFYQKRLRLEGKNIQILYQNYNTALLLTRIIEGEGISVVDLSETTKTGEKCIITENQDKGHSQTAGYLANIFDCLTVKGETGGYDIVMNLGQTLENEWEN